MKMMRATAEEKMAYKELDPLNPNVLHGFIQFCNRRLAVEYLGEGLDNPNYEVLAPKGYKFFLEGAHSLLGVTLKDLYERLEGDDLVACPEDCDCRLVVA